MRCNYCFSAGACYQGCDCAKCINPDSYNDWKQNDPEAYQAWKQGEIERYEWEDSDELNAREQDFLEQNG